MIKTFFQWLVYSSKNPSKVSLFIKGIGATLVSYNVLPLLGIDVGIDFDGLFEGIADFISNLLAIIPVSMLAWGAWRKVWKTILGTNHR